MHHVDLLWVYTLHTLQVRHDAGGYEYNQVGD